MKLMMNLEDIISLKNKGLAEAKSDQHSAANQRARVRDSLGKTLPCTLMAPGACKICRGCNVLHVPIQIIFLGISRGGEPSPPWKIKVVVGYVRTGLVPDRRQQSTTQLYSHVKPNQPTNLPMVPFFGQVLHLCYLTFLILKFFSF